MARGIKMIIQIIIIVFVTSGVIPILLLRRKESFKKVIDILPHTDLGRSLITLLNGVGILCTAFSLNVFGKTQPLIIALTLEICGLLFALLALSIYPVSLKLASIIEKEREQLIKIFYRSPEEMDKDALISTRAKLNKSFPQILDIITGPDKIYLYSFIIFYFYAYLFTLFGLIALLFGVGTNIQV